MKTIKGDLIKMAQRGEFDAIVHGANCFRTMGAGIALQIREAFPEAYAVDRKTTDGPHKLGTISYAIVNDDNDDLPLLYVVNAYTQVRPGPHFELDALRDCLSTMRDLFSGGVRIGMPKIGAGIGGGDWEKISAVIEEVLGDLDVTVVEYRPED